MGHPAQTLPELAAQVVSQHLLLDEIKAARTTCKAWQEAFSTVWVNVRINLQGPNCLPGIIQVATSDTLLPQTWPRVNRLVYNWDAWCQWKPHQPGGMFKLHGVLSCIDEALSAALSFTFSLLELESFPEEPSAIQALFLLQNIPVHLKSFSPPSIWHPYEQRPFPMLPFSWIPPSCSLTHLSCRLRDEFLQDTTSMNALCALSQLKSLSLFISCDQRRQGQYVYGHPNLDIGCLRHMNGLTHLSRLKQLTSLRVHTLAEKWHPHEADDGQTLVLSESSFRGIGPYFLLDHLKHLSCLTKLQELSLDVIPCLPQDNAVLGTPPLADFLPHLAMADSSIFNALSRSTSYMSHHNSRTASPAAFLLHLPALRSLSLRLHAITGVQDILAAAATLTHLTHLGVTDVVWVGRPHHPWQYSPAWLGDQELQDCYTRCLASLPKTHISWSTQQLYGPCRGASSELRMSDINMCSAVNLDFSRLNLQHLVVFEAFDIDVTCGADLCTLSRLTSLSSLAVSGFATCEISDSLLPFTNLQNLTNLSLSIMYLPSGTLSCALGPADQPLFAFDNQVAAAYGTALTALTSLNLQHVSATEDLTSDTMLRLMRKCSKLAHLDVNGHDLSHVARKIGNLRGDMGKVELRVFLEALLPQAVLDRARIMEACYNVDDTPNQYLKMLAHLVCCPTLRLKLAPLAAHDSVALLTTLKPALIEDSYQFLSRCLPISERAWLPQLHGQEGESKLSYCDEQRKSSRMRL